MAASPNTMMFSKGSTFNSEYVPKVDTGSVAEMSAAITNAPLKDSMECNPDWPVKYMSIAITPVEIKVPRTAKLRIYGNCEMKSIRRTPQPASNMSMGKNTAFNN
mmetsp:Transcript_81696/g.144726  ORF Transcript_81696/g.144726 Transcript_81696/m.144726 type:complete len:105 (+) Transcript_81696:1084-1398(+)